MLTYLLFDPDGDCEFSHGQGLDRIVLTDLGSWLSTGSCACYFKLVSKTPCLRLGLAVGAGAVMMDLGYNGATLWSKVSPGYCRAN